MVNAWKQAEEGRVANGTIKKIIPDRGFGFIRSEDGKEVFFHRSCCEGLIFETLKEGQPVDFDLEEAARGPRASNVRQGS
jgi:CspA family cold shock protein